MHTDVRRYRDHVRCFDKDFLGEGYNYRQRIIPCKIRQNVIWDLIWQQQ